MKNDIKKLLATPLFYFYGLSLSGCHTAVSNMMEEPEEQSNQAGTISGCHTAVSNIRPRIIRPWEQPNQAGTIASSRMDDKSEALDLRVSTDAMRTAAVAAAAAAYNNFRRSCEAACIAGAAVDSAVGIAARTTPVRSVIAAAYTAAAAYCEAVAVAGNACTAFKKVAKDFLKLAQCKNKDTLPVHPFDVVPADSIADAFTDAREAYEDAAYAHDWYTARFAGAEISCAATAAAAAAAEVSYSYTIAAAAACIVLKFCVRKADDCLAFAKDCKKNMVAFIDATPSSVYGASSATVTPVYTFGSAGIPAAATYTRASAAGYFVPPAPPYTFPPALPTSLPPDYDAAVFAGYNTSILIGNQTNKRKEDSPRTKSKKKKQ